MPRRQTTEACEAVVASIRGAGGEAVAVPCNVAERAQPETLVAAAVSQWGRLDTLVCNAAVNPYFGPMARMPDDAYERIMNTNVRSNFWLCSLAASRMAEQGGGSIIVISSIGANQGSATLGVYGMSKAADYALVRNLAVEWGRTASARTASRPG